MNDNSQNDNNSQSEIKILADILRVLIGQELGKSQEGSAQNRVYKKAYNKLTTLLNEGENNG